MKLSRRSIVVSCALALCLAVGLLPASPDPARVQAAPIHPAVLADLRAAPDGRSEFFVLLADQPDLTAAAGIDDWNAKGRWVFAALTATAEKSQARATKMLTSQALGSHVDRWQPFWIVNAIAVRGDEYAAQALAQQAGAAQILPAIKLEAPEVLPASAPVGLDPTLVEWNVRQINADDVWAMGYTGEGMVVANVDTGVDYAHPALVNQYRGNQGAGAAGPFDHNYNWFDPYWETTEPHALPDTATSSTPNFHGTHVMGTEAGDDGSVNQIGVAPGARWIAGFGCCVDNASLLAALQWMLAPTRLDGSEPNPDLRPHAVQNSWGGPGGSLIFNQAAETLTAAGIFVSASAGNSGGYGCGSLGSPGDNPAFFNVGAGAFGGGLSFLSSRGPDPFTGRTGPSLIAPGEGVVSAYANGDYQSLSGTSMAGPHVAGAVALLWNANPALIGRVGYTAELLRKTATPVFVPGELCGGIDSGTTHPNNSAGWGRLDILRAVQVAGNGTSQVLVQVVDDTGTALPDISVKLSTMAPDGAAVELEGVTDSDGQFEFLIAPGTVSVEARAFGYTGSAVSGVSVEDGVRTVSLTLHLLPQYTLHGTVIEQSMRRTHLPLIASNGAVTVDAQPSQQVSNLTFDATKRLSARVSLPDSPLPPVTTDCTGAFSLTLPAGLHTLLVEATGYETQRIPIYLMDETARTLIMRPTLDYLVSDSRTGDVAFDWIDATGGTRHQLSDDSAKRAEFPAGQTFIYYGQEYADLYFTSNGFVTFGYPFSRFHGTVPFEGLPNNAIYAYAEDLNPAADAQYGTGFDNGIYTLQDGDRLVIQYNEVEHWAKGDPETFELILDLATGEFTMQYLHVSWPDFTTVAIEDENGQRGVSYSYANSADLQAGLAVRFSPIFGQPGLSCPP